MPGGDHCLFLSERCATHAHEREPVSLTTKEPKRICPCEDLANQGCLRAPASIGGPSRVGQACAEVNLPHVRLRLGEEKQNRDRIQALPPGPNAFGNYLQQFYTRKKIPADGAALLAIANSGNQQFLKDSPLKTASIQYSGSASRLANPDAYLKAFLKAARDVSPQLQKRIDAYLTFKHPMVKASVIRVADKTELNELVGRYRTKDSGGGKTVVREITLSTESNASLPNQFSTLFHELVHAENFEPHSTLVPGSPAYAEAELLDEAKAYEAQMGFYLELVRSDPQFFCNWLHVTNRYGNLVVPLAWVMAAVEMELASGTFMAREAERIDYKDKEFLLGKGGGLRPDLRARLQSLGFVYAR